MSKRNIKWDGQAYLRTLIFWNTLLGSLGIDNVGISLLPDRFLHGECCRWWWRSQTETYMGNTVIDDVGLSLPPIKTYMGSVVIGDVGLRLLPDWDLHGECCHWWCRSQTTSRLRLTASMISHNHRCFTNQPQNPAIAEIHFSVSYTRSDSPSRGKFYPNDYRNSVSASTADSNGATRLVVRFKYIDHITTSMSGSK